MEKNESTARLLKESLKEGVYKKEADIKVEPKDILPEILSQYILDYQECKWYQFFRRSYLAKKIKSLQIKKDGSILLYGLTNLKNDTTEVSMSASYFAVETTDVTSMKYDIRDELAIELVKRGYITFEEKRTTENDNEMITVKAIINVKK